MRLSDALADRYRIARELGQGGMATVYLAQDVKHDRNVALKVLKPELAAVLGAERFVVEIRTTASLQHPHILPLFDSGTADGFLFYVMPYIEGETLRAKLDRETQLGIDEAVRITTQVADALDYAHRHGVIHRDIKPENILLHDGRPMVADFGIALAVSAAAGGRMTETGLSLGTPHYMSPEQATADKDITARSDIYSLASVLYEMLTGNPPHVGSSAQQVIMRIIADTPRPVSDVRRSVPPNVAAAIGKALEKLPADRFESAARFAQALADLGFRTTAVATAGLSPLDARHWVRDRRTLTTITLAVSGVVAALTWGLVRSPAGVPEVMRLTVEIDSAPNEMMTNEHSHGPPVVSPDGRSVAFAGQTRDTDQLRIRVFDRFEAGIVSGGGRKPFYSPDGRWLGFARGGAIWRVRVDGGEPVPVGTFASDDWGITGACWLADGRILVTTFTGLWSADESGGRPSLLVRSDSVSGESFAQPVPLDDYRVMVELRSTGRPTRMVVLSTRSGERTLLPDAIEPPATVAEDLIVFGLDPVRAARFDRRTLTLIGSPLTLSGVPGQRHVSATGSLAWFEHTAQAYELVWVSPGGRETALGVAPGRYRWPRLSPDGTALVLGISESDPRFWLWTTNLRTGRRARLGTQLGSAEPVWTPDGTRVIFALGEPPDVGLLIQPADASQPPDTLYPGPLGSWPTDVSPDGSTVAFYGSSGTEADDLHFLKMSDRSIRRVPRPGIQRGGRFSPDGRWFAYESTENGSPELHVQPWPALNATWVVSSDGGREPAWSHDGRRLFYRRGGGVFVVEVGAGPSWTGSTAREVANGGWFSDLHGDQSWDVAGDGRFLMLRLAPGSRGQVRVIRNWITEFRATLEASPRRAEQTGAR